ncbi:hypothetical protein V8G54_024700 [Vigna mungo]|uniref:Uncharacterized protein n=1 Tax=Vigna mungo TaxID=3915 RepID=A0AAQ3RQD5_VIGMU
MVNAIRFHSNNLCSFNISWSTQYKKKNSLNWFYKRDRAEWGYFTNNLSRIYWCCPFFRNGWNGYPNAKNIHDFHYLIDGFSCITGHERFCCRIDSIIGNNYQSKISFHHKNTHNFCNRNWNDINSYLFIIYLTSNVLWIQAF